MDQVETGGVRSEIGEFAFLKLTVCERLKRKYEVGNMIFWAPQNHFLSFLNFHLREYVSFT